MMIFDLVFILLVFTTVGTLITVVVLLLLKHFKTALKFSLIYGVGLLLYLGILITVSLISPQREIVMGEDWCFDDWCLAVENVSYTQELGAEHLQAQTNDVFCIVTIRLSNQARGRDQRASSTAIHLLDREGQIYNIIPIGQAAFEAEYGATSELTSTIPLGQSITVMQVFEIPQDAQEMVLTVEHPVGQFPGLFIIGSEASLFHKPKIVRLP